MLILSSKNLQLDCVEYTLQALPYKVCFESE